MIIVATTTSLPAVDHPNAARSCQFTKRGVSAQKCTKREDEQKHTKRGRRRNTQEGQRNAQGEEELHKGDENMQRGGGEMHDWRTEKFMMGGRRN